MNVRLAADEIIALRTKPTELSLTRRGVLAGLTALAAFSPPTVVHATSNSIRVALCDGCAPLSFPDDNKAMTGLLVRTIGEVTKKLDWQVSFTGYPWARAQTTVRDGDSDALCTTPTDARKEYALFCTEPLFELVTTAHFLPGNPKAEQIRAAKSIDDLRRFTIGDYIGNGWSTNLYKGWDNVQWAQNPELLVRMLVANHVDLIIQPHDMFGFNRKKLGVTEKVEMINVDFLPNARSPMSFGLRKSLPGVEKMIADFQAAQHALIADGTIDAVRRDFAAD